MGYEVRKGKNHGYRVLFEKKTKTERTRHAVPPEALKGLGFEKDWNVEQAKAYAKKLNKLTLGENRAKVEAARRAELAKVIDSVFFPPSLVKDFETHLAELTMGAEERLSTLLKHWSTTQRLLSELKLSPEQYYDERFKIFNRFLSERYSVDYVKRLRYMINLWGSFYSRKRKVFFEPLPKLSGTQWDRVAERHDDKPNVRQDPTPLPWSTLLNAEQTFVTAGLEKQWNWLYIAMAFGLRPLECDGLLTPEGKRWKIVRDGKVDVLFVYQTKLRGVPKAKRWKPIPALEPEQKKALKLIQLQNFKRPLVASIRRYLEGAPYCTYSPRKAFTDWMQERGFDIYDIAVFMGHRSLEAFTGDRGLDMTWKHYKDKMRFKLPSAS